MFIIDSTKKVKINKDTYLIHDHILKKATIFSPLFDETIIKSNVSTIKYSISSDLIDKVFRIMYGINDCITMQDKPVDISTLKFIVNIVSYMQYIGINFDSLYAFIYNFMGGDKTDPHEIINDLKNEPHSEHLLLIFKYIRYPRIVKRDNKLSDNVVLLKKIIDDIKSYDHSDKLKIYIARKLINNCLYDNKYDLILGINGKYAQDFGNDDFYHINFSTKTAKLKSIKKLYKEFFNINVTHKIKFSNLRITKLIINGTKIPLYKYKEVDDTRGYGGNLKKTIAAHIAKVLLGIETL